MSTDLELASSTKTVTWWMRVTVIFKPSRGKRRVWDHVTQLEHQLADAQRTIEVLSAENHELRVELMQSGEFLDGKLMTISELENQLRTAIRANEINHRRINVPMMVRDTSDMVDQATVPVPLVSPTGRVSISPPEPPTMPSPQMFADNVADDTRPIVTIAEPTNVRMSDEQTEPEIDVRSLRATLSAPAAWDPQGFNHVVLTLQQVPTLDALNGHTQGLGTAAGDTATMGGTNDVV